MFYYTQKSSSLLVARKMEISDNVIPASNSIMAHNLFTLGTIKTDDEMINHARIMLQNVKSSLSKGQVYYANWDLLMMRFLEPSKELVIMGEECINWNLELQKKYTFNTVFLGSYSKEYLPLMEKRYQKGQSLIYLCKDRVCNLPVNEPSLLQSNEPFIQ